MRPVLIRQPPVAAAAPILEVIARLRHVQADPSARTQVDRTALNAGPLCANLLFGQERQIASRSDLRSRPQDVRVAPCIRITLLRT